MYPNIHKDNVFHWLNQFYSFLKEHKLPSDKLIPNQNGVLGTKEGELFLDNTESDFRETMANQVGQYNAQYDVIEKIKLIKSQLTNTNVKHDLVHSKIDRERINVQKVMTLDMLCRDLLQKIKDEKDSIQKDAGLKKGVISIDECLSLLGNQKFVRQYFSWFDDNRAILLVDAVLNSQTKEKLYEIVRAEEKIESLSRLAKNEFISN